jgi:phosphoribosylformylglycinamidine cyclo-ligase
MVVVVNAADAQRAAAALVGNGENVFRIGVVDRRRPGEAQTIVA